MSERTGYKPGEFSWVDLSTTDVEAAGAYYRELMGWDIRPAGPPEETKGYGFFVKDGKMVGGIGPVFSEGRPSTWNSYVTVVDADATAARIREAGGTVVAEPMDLPADAGRMGVAMDPGGALFSFIQQGAGSVGAQIVNEPGAWTWNNLNAKDMEQAKRFYGEVFGWEARVSDGAPPDSPYLNWHVEGQTWPEGIAGLSDMARSGFPGGVPSHWQVYLAVPDAEAAAETTRSAGGTVLLRPLALPRGKLAILADPQGAVFGIIEPDYPEPR